MLNAGQRKAGYALLFCLGTEERQSMNEKSELKVQRMKSYFLEAAKQIITAEGAENISARRVAEIAGYSYATIYNYFKDIDELLGETKAFMVTDVIKHMQAAIDFTINNTEDLVKMFVAYTGYYLDHPHIFRFFYCYRLSDTESAKEQYDFNLPWAAALQFLIEDGRLKECDMETCAKTVIYSVHGLMALYFSGNGLTEEMLLADINKVIQYIVRG